MYLQLKRLHSYTDRGSAERTTSRQPNEANKNRLAIECDYILRI